MVTRLGASCCWLSVFCHYSVYTINCSSGLETSTCTSWGWNVNTVTPLLSQLCSNLTSLRTLTPESRPWWAESRAWPLSGLETLPRPDFCLAWVRMWDFRLVDWANFLLQPCNANVILMFLANNGESSPQMDTHKAGLQCVFSHVFSNWSLRRISCHNPRMCTAKYKRLG